LLSFALVQRIRSIMRKPWNNWFHCTGSTYGAWLRGDQRGRRDRKGKISVPYDYKNPPPAGMYAGLYRYCLKLMTRDAVVLKREECEIACRKFVEALRFHGVEFVDVCVTPTHFHALCRFVGVSRGGKSPGIAIPGPGADARATRIRDPRHLIGIAKKESARALSKMGLRPKSGIWAVRGKNKEIRDRIHQVRVARYIRAHVKRGGIVWSLHKEKWTPG